LVVAIDIDFTTLAFARENLDRAGYTDTVLVHGRGGLGSPEHAPYDAICITAACPDVPPPLVDELAPRGRLMHPSYKARANDSPFSRRSRPASGARSSQTCCTSPWEDGTALETVRTPDPTGPPFGTSSAQ
jgi:protein-L-isoaspartate O-methyltransferase